MPSTLLSFTLSAYSCKHLPSSKSQSTYRRVTDSFYPYYRVMDFPPHCPASRYTATCILQNVNKLPISQEADFNCRTDVQVGAHLSTGNCWEDALANTSASNRNQSTRLGPWRARALAAIMHQSLHPCALLTVQLAVRNGSMYDNHIFMWLYRGITNFPAQFLPFDPLAPTPVLSCPVCSMHIHSISDSTWEIPSVQTSSYLTVRLLCDVCWDV